MVTAMGSVGHMNACVGVVRPLLARGHRVVFFIDQPYQGRLKEEGFEEYVYQMTSINDCSKSNPVANLARKCLDMKLLGTTDIEVQYEGLRRQFFESEEQKQTMGKLDGLLKKAIEQVKPDCLVVDPIYLLPVVNYCGIPWIRVNSMAPLYYMEVDELPPGGCGKEVQVLQLQTNLFFVGLSIHSDRQTWDKYRKIQSIVLYSKLFNNVIESLGYERYRNDAVIPRTDLITVYAFPNEMNYPHIDERWFNLEVFNKNEAKEVVDLKMMIGKDFLEDDLDGKFSGKLIYVGFGTLATVDVGWMKRLVSALSQTNHKYIIATGPLHYEYQLARNMWGEPYLPQTRIIPLVDLVITHGGNNTLTETFAQGKPMLLMPFFTDQLDNSLRIVETGFGEKVLPYSFTDEELTESIDRLLNNRKLQSKLVDISKRIQSSTLHEQLCGKIEQLLS